MATALARGFQASQQTDDGPTISYFDPSPEACAHFSETISTATNMADATEVVATADIVFLAVKPQVLPTVLDSIATVVTSDVLLVSIAAGVSGNDTIDSTLDFFGRPRMQPEQRLLAKCRVHRRGNVVACTRVPQPV